MSEQGPEAAPLSRDPFDVPDRAFNTLEGWTWIGCYGGYYLSSDLLNDQGFEHGFFTRRWQGREPDELVTYLSAGTTCLLYTSPSPRDRQKSRMPSSA